MSAVVLTVAGLCFDLIGVLALGYDVVRLQRAVKSSADANFSAYSDLEEQFGGAPDWLKDIRKAARWIPGYAFQDHHAEDEVSYNARHLTEVAKDAADAAAGVGEYVVALAGLLRARAEEDAKLAQSSLRFSAFGLAFIVVGFILQAAGSLTNTYQ